MRRWLNTLPAVVLWLGCSDPAHSHSHDAPSCDERAETMVAGLTKINAEGYQFELLTLEPDVPVISTHAPGNVWRVRVTDAAGEPVDAATLSVSTFMPDHNHAGPSAIGISEAPGTYRIESLLFPMPAQYTVSLTVRPSGAGAGAQSVRFMPCLGARSG